jgi:N-acetylmuramic acid 6-phosphate etherase
MNNFENLNSLILDLLLIKPSTQSEYYLTNEKQYQLHNLVTEQRHLKTWNLSSLVKNDTESGVESYLLVDKDISKKIIEICDSTNQKSLINQATKSIESCILNKRKIYIYGCGATGRLAKQIECGFWKPFWKKMRSNPIIWEKIEAIFGNDYDFENSLIGEITGGDRAIISSLEGFEDLKIIGSLQLKQHRIKMNDLVLAVTEGGETSSVIGTILEALDQYDQQDQMAKNNLYFIYNNPNDVLMSLDRSREVIQNDKITKICLATGPQAITGSTRLQATTISTFVIGIMIENALNNIFKRHLTKSEMEIIGFKNTDFPIENRLMSFLDIEKSVFEMKNLISKLVDLESDCYKNGNLSTYTAKKALITIFTDATERSPTFNLYPLDNVEEKERKSWIQVWTDTSNQQAAWQELLGRSFQGLNENIYHESFFKIDNPYLKEAALRSLTNAGNNQQFLYDFSFSQFNIEKRGPRNGDLLVQVFLYEEIKEIVSEKSKFYDMIKLFVKNNGKIAILIVVPEKLNEKNEIIKRIRDIFSEALILQLVIDISNDPLNIKQQIAIKMLLNCHSTCLMTKLGRVVGNTMTSVKPGNLKLIGRATNLIRMHVNHTLENASWNNENMTLTYEEANAVLFDCIEYTRNSGDIQEKSEVSLSIIRILETLKSNSFISWEQAKNILKLHSLEGYLLSF